MKLNKKGSIRGSRSLEMIIKNLTWFWSQTWFYAKVGNFTAQFFKTRVQFGERWRIQGSVTNVGECFSILLSTY